MAQKINKSKSLISKYENNQKLPTLETLIDLSIFDVSLDFLAGKEKGKTIMVNNLTASQIDIINALMKEFHSSKPKYVTRGLTTRQLDIFNGLIIEFTKIE
ncbi:helix-turn-helix domain-containing protein [Lacrimispora celerecrescens]|uniref:helix-turn-helix domain-containing protein n=1 Tax=Lacrimispora celerecrescens TaxID=29354 RepID=UPI0012FD84DB|nr:helix-turn-helix transcriptional regulator [Lacrimispora celerecrescens]